MRNQQAVFTLYSYCPCNMLLRTYTAMVSGGCGNSSASQMALLLISNFLLMTLKLGIFSFVFSLDVSHSESWRRGVWNTPYHPSPWGGVRYGSSRGGLDVPRATRPPQPSSGIVHPTVPTPEPGAPLDHHLQKHDGSGRWTNEQWTPRGKDRVVITL